MRIACYLNPLNCIGVWLIVGGIFPKPSIGTTNGFESKSESNTRLPWAKRWYNTILSFHKSIAASNISTIINGWNETGLLNNESIHWLLLSVSILVEFWCCNDIYGRRHWVKEPILRHISFTIYWIEYSLNERVSLNYMLSITPYGRQFEKFKATRRPNKFPYY